MAGRPPECHLAFLGDRMGCGAYCAVLARCFGMIVV